MLHASADPWATGPFATVDGGLGTDVDVLVGRCWDPARAGPRPACASGDRGRTYYGGRLSAGRRHLAGGRRRRAASGYLAAGMDELHLYHLWPACAAGLQVMARLVAAAEDAGRPAT